MKKLIIALALIMLSNLICVAQDNKNHNYKNTLSLGLSINKLSIGYQRSFESTPLWGQVYAGLGNQDITKSFDDLLCGIKLGAPILKFTKSNIYAYANVGLYFANNDYYVATTPFVGAGLGYRKEFGTSRRHAFIAEIGYEYGKKRYTQTYTADALIVSTSDVFKLAPLTFSLGYGYKF